MDLSENSGGVRNLRVCGEMAHSQNAVRVPLLSNFSQLEEFFGQQEIPDHVARQR
jgi:hypothetical protein